MISLDTFTLLDILPPNLIETDEDKAMALSISAALKLLANRISLLEPSSAIQEKLLDIVAWEKHVDFYNSSLPIEQKRRLIENADLVHSHKGTPFAVKEVGKIFLSDADVEEWFKYNGQPYHFKLRTKDLSLDEEKIDRVIKAIDSVKRKSTRLEKIVIEMNSDMDVFYGAAIHVGEKIIIK